MESHTDPSYSNYKDFEIPWGDGRRYQMGSKLGSGSFSSVTEGVDLNGTLKRVVDPPITLKM